MDEMRLINLAQEGDLEAFNQLVLSYQMRVYNVAYYIMKEKDSAADAAQDAFISAFRKLRTYRGGSFSAWLLRIVTNVCLDELRRRKRRPIASLDEELLDSDRINALDPGGLTAHLASPEKSVEQFELADAIKNCIQQLPPDFRAIIILIDMQGYGYREASDMVRKPLGTVKSRLARARARVRDCLQRYRELLPESYRLNDEVIK
jgi:RNA polymerase sigma-70 factor (ECF subfamily)